MTKISFIMTENNIICSVGKKKGTIKKDHPNYKEAAQSIIDGDLNKLATLTIPGYKLEEYSHLEFQIKEGQIYRYGEEILPVELSNLIIDLADKGLPYIHLLNFWDRLQKNPVESSIQQLFRFIQKNGITIAEDGRILGYKSVKKNMTDHHTGRIKYDLLTTVSMPRSMVVSDPCNACGPGLHFGSYEYAKGFEAGGVLLEVLVDPEHVVSVPEDCRSGKCRTCELFVSAICSTQHTEVSYKTPVDAKSKLKERDQHKEKSISKSVKKSTSKSVKKSTPVKDKSVRIDNSMVRIGNFNYTRSLLKDKELKTLLASTTNPFNKLIKSEFPKFFVLLGVQNVYRQKIGKSFNYIATNDNINVIYDVVVK